MVSCDIWSKVLAYMPLVGVEAPLPCLLPAYQPRDGVLAPLPRWLLALLPLSPALRPLRPLSSRMTKAVTGTPPLVKPGEEANESRVAIACKASQSTS